MLGLFAVGCRQKQDSGSVNQVKKYVVSFEAKDGGSLTAQMDGKNFSKGGKAKEGAVITFTAVPAGKDEKEVAEWTVKGGKIVSGGKALDTETKVKITSDTTVTVSFRDKTFSVKIDTPVNGTLTVAPSIPENSRIKKGTPLTFTATPAENFSVDKWEIEGGSFSSGGGAGETTASVTVNSDIIVKVKFKTDVKYTVTFSTLGASGTITAKVDGEAENSSGSITVPANSIVTFSAKKENKTALAEWIVDGTKDADATSKINKHSGINTLSKKITKNTDVKAKFEDVFQLRYDVDFTGAGSCGFIRAVINGEEISLLNPLLSAGTQVKFKLTLNEGYTLTGWTLDGAEWSEAGTNNVTPVLTMDKDHTVTAKVKANIDVPEYFEKDGIFYKVVKISEIEKIVYITSDKNKSGQEKHLYSGKLHIPATVTYGEHTFKVEKSVNVYSKGLTSVTVDAGNETLYAVDGVLFNKAYRIYNEALLIYPDAKPDTEYTVPSGVKEINIYWAAALTKLTVPEGAAYITLDDCPKLAEVNLPSSLKSITGFRNMPIKELVIPKNVNYISGGAFSNCPELERAEIKCSIAGFDTFKNCPKLKEVICHSAVPFEIKSNNGIFTGSPISEAELKVPQGSGAAYKQANVWKNFKIITEFTPSP